MIAKAHRLAHVKEYYFSTKLREVASLQKEGKPIINIAIGSPDLQPPEAVVTALKESLHLANVHQYQSYQGIPEFRAAVSQFYKKKYQVILNPDTEILPLMGSKEGIMHISMAFLNEGDQVLIPNPGYPTYTSVTKLVGAEPVFYNLSEASQWLPDLDALEKTPLSKVKMMWINYPHMPTGAVADLDYLAQLVSFAKKHQILLVNDNPYSFILNKSPLSILAVKGATHVALELNSLSKTFHMAGWRVGMLVGAPELIKTVLQVKSNMDSGMFLGVQKGAVAALQTPNSWFQEQNKTYEKRRELVWEIFDVLQCTYSKNTAGLFVWGKLPKGADAIEFTNHLLYQKNIFISPGTVFGSQGEGYIRASLCVSVSKLKEVLHRLQTKI
ncbi:pyridoxal phosphate-dependent aminotransferase [Lutibacter sp.]